MMELLDKLEGVLEKVFEKIPYSKLTTMDPKGRWGIVAGAPLVVIILFYFALIRSVSAETATLEEELTNAKQQVAINREIEKNLPKLEKQMKELDYQLELLRLQLPKGREIPNLLDQISNLGTKSGLEFMVFRPVPESEEDFYAKVPVSLKMVGSFHDLAAFFDKVSRMPRIITVTNLDISLYQGKDKKRSNGTLVEATCLAVTYRFLEAKVDVAPDEKGKKK